MRRVTLHDTPIETSALGFGCVSLTSHPSRRQAIAMLEQALDGGITHFDVARMYGFGQCENILGEFLQGKRDRVTVTTKFGLEPNRAMAKHRRLVSFARKVKHALPFLGRLAHRTAGPLVQAGAFDPTSAARSLETSLRDLRTDYVDILLLHEGTLPDARREDLIQFLDAQMTRGVIRSFGIGSRSDHIQGDAGLFPEKYKVFQFENNPLKPNLERIANLESRAVITHSALALMKSFAAATAANPTWTTRWSAEVGADVMDRQIVANLLLRYALAANRRGVVLMATTRAEHLETSLGAARDAAACRSDDPQIQAFARVVREALTPRPVTARGMGTGD